MNERQKRFAEYVAQCGNRTEAARLAGYSDSYAEHRADELWRNVEVQEYYQSIVKKTQDDRIMTAKDRQALLSDIANDTDNSPSDRIRAVDTLNKMTGEYITKVQAEVNTSEKLADIFRQLGGGDDLE